MQPSTSIVQKGVPIPLCFEVPLCASNDANSIHALPPEVIQHLFTHFRDEADFSTLSKTCRRMYIIASHIPVYAVSAIRDRRFGNLSGFAFLRNHDARASAEELAVEIAQQNSLENQPCQAIQEKEEALYKTFKQCCFRLDVKISMETADVYKIAHLGIQKVIQTYATDPLHFTLAMRSNDRLCQKLDDDFIATTVNQLTVETLYSDLYPNSKVLEKTINQGLRSGIHFSDIQQRLRKALRSKYQTILENKALEYSRAALTSPLVAGIKEQQMRDLLAQKAEIEAEMLQLRGPSNFNGTIHNAYMELENLNQKKSTDIDEAELNAAETEFRSLCNFGWVFGQSNIELLLQLDVHNSLIFNESIKSAHARLLAAADPLFHKRKAAEAKYNDLDNRLNTLAQWQPDTDILIGGELFEVNNKLQCISDNKLALTKAQLMGQFYQELATPVTDANKIKRCSCLQEIYNELKKLP